MSKREAQVNPEPVVTQPTRTSPATPNKGQMAEEQRDRATAEQVKNLTDQVSNHLDGGLTAMTVMLTQLKLLMGRDYWKTGDNFTQVSLFQKKMLQLQDQIVGRAMKVQPTAMLELPPAPPTPSADQAPDAVRSLNEDQSAYDHFITQYDLFKSLFLKALPLMKQVVTLLKTPIDQKKDWALAYLPKKISYDNMIILSKTLGLYKAGSVRTAYPLSFQWKPQPAPADIKSWKTIAAQIHAFGRAYPSYTFPQILYHFTKDWDMFDRYKFKNWYKWTEKSAEAGGLMKKTAQQDFVMQDRQQKFEKKRKLLQSRIDLVKKGLRDLLNSGLIDNNKGSKMYRILAMLEYEAMGLSAPKLAAARIRRTSKQLMKLGFVEGASILSATAHEYLTPVMVKTAEDEEKKKPSIQETTELLKRIKREMDKLNYNAHLDEMYSIKKELEKIGRQGDAESMLKVIREDLDSLDKLNKKLTEVYTNLSRVPMELSMEEDKTAPSETVKEMPIEVSEEDLEKPAPVAQPERSQMKPRPVAKPAAPAPAPVQAPKIQTEIPNV